MPTEVARQLSLLAQGHSSDGWEQVIFLVIMGGLWLAGALAKVFNARKGAGPQRPPMSSSRPRETWQQRLARAAQQIQRAAEAQARPRPTQPSPPAGKIAVRTDQKGDSILVYQRPAANHPRRAGEPVAAGRQETPRQRQPVVMPRFDVLDSGSQPLAEAITAAKIDPSRSFESTTVSPEMRSQDHASDAHSAVVLDIGDANALRQAVLYAEILGKPVALRNPFEGTTTS